MDAMTTYPPAPATAFIRVFKQVLTMTTNFVAAATVADSDATLTGLPGGKTLKVRVTAASDAGERLPSAEVTAVVG